ncbi:zinc ABC transporter substrate-binding protein [Wohlfahrtiimonas chitiniclastica]|uniref:metal ABC transporter solute-binding protein, Zn/Mn family n=1 Tax=Wohlfahrtiimonas chitiniclastica TaxID=400946 RepID=UPI001BCE1658|nr:zinc ABC transporter substrate-binding protein [Wohlfahrtiimonas chitiniclastica]MBS7814716.1 zinc ABC transporter substrate-binding protein [Wohlfahrtiimonas chitiniclastica]
MKKLLLSALFASSLSLSFAELNVVTSFSILEDITANIGQDKVKITSMIKRNQNPHNYEPTMSDIQSLYNADLLIINGLNFEHWLKRATKQSNFKGEIVTASDGIKVIHLAEDEQHHHHHDHDDHDHDHHHHDHGDTDPHVWQNPLNGIIMANNIAKALSEKDPENSEFYAKNLETYQEKLHQVDQTIMNSLNDNPSQPLKGIVLHDSYRYFSERYPMMFFPVLDAHSLSEPSVKVFAGIQTMIKDNQIPVIFSESMEQSRFVNTVVKDYHITDGGQLISDTIMPKGEPCDSYIGLLECNLNTINQAFDKVRKAKDESGLL